MSTLLRLARSVIAISALAVLLVAPAALAATPVYNDPPTYDGRQRAPATQPAPEPQLPPAVSLAPTGLAPRTVVDDAGTAHIVWAEGGDQDGLADRAIYCRLKRGAKDVRHPPHAAGGAGVLLQHRLHRARASSGWGTSSSSSASATRSSWTSPTAGPSSTVWAWTSNDGGTSWSDPAIVGKRAIGDMVVIGPSNDPSILNFQQDAFCGLCITEYKSGEYSADSGDLAARSGDSYYAQMELDSSGRPVVSWVNLDGTTYFRRW